VIAFMLGQMQNLTHVILPFLASTEEQVSISRASISMIVIDVFLSGTGIGVYDIDAFLNGLFALCDNAVYMRTPCYLADENHSSFVLSSYIRP
jgi:putative methionine-R-sulfoxide reductase with GAF domain